jgi:hypothetical protein
MSTGFHLVLRYFSAVLMLRAAEAPELVDQGASAIVYRGIYRRAGSTAP